MLSVSTAFLFLFSLTGLATHDAGDAAAEQVAGAAAATTRTGTAVIELRFRMQSEGIDATMTGTGAVDFAAGRASLTLTTPGRQPVDLVVDGETLYQRDPNQPPRPGAKPWVATPVDSGGFIPAGAGTSGDPLTTLRLLEDEGGLRDVRQDGDDEVGGVRASRYVAGFDTDELRRQVGEMRPEAAAMARTMQFEDASLVAWISDDGLLRRVETAISIRVGDQAFEMSSSFDLRDFGAAVHIEVPPPDQVGRLAG